MKPIYVSIAVEGGLDEGVLRRVLATSGRGFVVTACYGKRGKDYLRQNAARFNNAAVHHPFILLADLDDDVCPPVLLARWLPQGKHANLLLRIAVKEIEAWLLADAAGLATFLGVRAEHMPRQPDTEQDPKAVMIELARRSRKREIRDDLVPVPGSTSKTGRNYVGQLLRFASDTWNVTAAQQRSVSLRKAVAALHCFAPCMRARHCDAEPSSRPSRQSFD